MHRLLPCVISRRGGMRTKIKLNGSRLRLLLAGCLCVFLFQATLTTHSDESGCSQYDKGDLLVTNKSSKLIVFSFTGMGSDRWPFDLKPNSSQGWSDLESGSYKYVIIGFPHVLLKTGDFFIYPQTTVKVVYQ